MSQLTGIRACVFDAYGTIFDFASAAARCPNIPDDKRGSLTALWRDKQVQYTWLRSLQGRYADFWQVTGEALDFTLNSLGIATPGLRERPMDLYLTLSAFPEVQETLRRLCHVVDSWAEKGSALDFLNRPLPPRAKCSSPLREMPGAWRRKSEGAGC